MALNQTQRDHAIQMIKDAANNKRGALRVTPLSEKDFIEAHIITNKIESLTVAQIRNGISEDRWSGYNFNPLKAFGIATAYNDHVADFRKRNDKACEKLDELEKQLIGEVMFGTDYSVIAAALETISNYK